MLRQIIIDIKILSSFLFLRHKYKKLSINDIKEAFVLARLIAIRDSIRKISKTGVFSFFCFEKKNSLLLRKRIIRQLLKLAKTPYSFAYDPGLNLKNPQPYWVRILYLL